VRKLNQKAVFEHHLSTKTVQSLALTLQSINHVHRSHGLTTSVFRVGNRVANDILEEHLEHTPGLFVDKARDTFHTTTTGETTDCGFCDSLDVVTEDLAVALTHNPLQLILRQLVPHLFHPPHHLLHLNYRFGSDIYRIGFVCLDVGDGGWWEWVEVEAGGVGVDDDGAEKQEG